MSPTNLELLIHGLRGWGRDNPANMRELFSQDCELIVPDSVPFGGVVRGADAMIKWYTQELWRWFDELNLTPEGVIDGGDQIVVPVHVRARAKNGKILDSRYVWIYELSDGKLIRARFYGDTAVVRDVLEGVIPAER